MYPLKLHPNLTVERWSRYPVDQQILMIANEVSRLRNGFEGGAGEAESIETMDRLFELVDLTVAKARPELRRELLRWRELCAELYITSIKRWPPRPLDALFTALMQMTSGSARAL